MKDYDEVTYIIEPSKDFRKWTIEIICPHSMSREQFLVALECFVHDETFTNLSDDPAIDEKFN